MASRVHSGTALKISWWLPHLEERLMVDMLRSNNLTVMPQAF